ncbi:MAG TPA: valine--tRNA ligase [Bryobacteraceae bacterium]|nr:valine--tRNA ligase [Bryobacteraceae bacterium]
MEIEKVYEPQRFEPRWAREWVESNLFHVEAPPPGTPYFSLVIPPPNVTGSLHMGHMFEHSIIDAQVRWRRMRGEITLWVPGTDHAGIATQIMVERQLAEEGKSRHDLGREAFEERVWKWKNEYGGKIVEQMQRAGVSCDWTRARFTLDPGLSRAVREAFVRLYEKGLIYRGQYMVNWCPRCQTAVSDLEVEHEETQGNLWHIVYPVEGSSIKLVVATTRPETMLGDSAVAINPRDKRAAELRDKRIRLPLTDRLIPIVLDEMADPEFGSGAVKITPAHDPNDFEAGKRHHLPAIKVIDENAKMTSEAGAFAGLDRFEARKKVVAELEKLGLLEKIEPHKLSIAKCHRCRTIVEPLVSTQWWVKIQPLADPAIAAVKLSPKRIEFVPAVWEKTYLNWMENIRDWCISRQLWWGHRIPAWHCGNCKQITVARETPDACTHCGSKDITQETDVLDTWFSSGLWPFSTLGWPDDTADLRAFYPTTLLVTGFDIIFFWAARMIMLGMEMMGDVPFRQVHIHGLVRDAERQKMSKTKGNTIDPLVINDKYGTDAVRFALLISAAPGNDIALSEDRIASCRNFANKVWNASRLLFSKPKEGPGEPVSLADRWIGHRLSGCAENVNRAFEAHRYNDAAQELWHFFWDDFCDWYLEMKKPDADWSYAYVVYEKALRLLHPLMPFLTEELWHRLDLKGPSIALERYPEFDVTDADAAYQMAAIQRIVTEIRQGRASSKIDKSQALRAEVLAGAGQVRVIEANIRTIERLANVTLTVDVGPLSVKLNIPIDRMRLEKENAELEKVIANSMRQLDDAEVIAKMPEKVVEMLRGKLAGYEAQLKKNNDLLRGE